MKWFRQLYLNLKKNATVIQRGSRRFLARRDMIKKRLVTYLGQELSIMSNVKAMEHYQLFGVN